MKQTPLPTCSFKLDSTYNLPLLEPTLSSLPGLLSFFNIYSVHKIQSFMSYKNIHKHADVVQEKLQEELCSELWYYVV